MLIERESELACIDRALDGALAGSGWLQVFEGPAGIGKTALLDVTRERAERAGVVVLAGRGGELEGGFPYGVVRQLLEPVVRTADTVRRARLLAGAASFAEPAVLGVEAGAVSGADPAFAIVHGLYWLVANLASESPVALVVDDVQWSDAPSLRFLTYLARRLDGLPTTVIASVRRGDGGSDPEFVRGFEQSPGARTAAPAPLSEPAVSSLLEAAFGVEPEPGFVRACCEVTRGNPFFVRELAAALIADGIGPRAEATQGIAAIGPTTVARVILPRLGSLSKHAAGLAYAIAVLGGDARLPRAASLAGLDGQQALVALDVLVATDVIAAGVRLEFIHPIVRMAIYDEIAPGERSAMHRRVADLLAGEGAELDSVARHLLLSEPGGSPETIAILRKAAAQALTLGAPENAAAYLSRALEEGCKRDLRLEILMELGTAERLARRPMAVARLQEVLRLADDPAVRARTMVELAELLLMLGGDTREPLALLDAVVSDNAGHDQALIVRAEAARAMVAAYSPRLVPGFDDRLPALHELVADACASARPLAMLLACVGAQRGASRDHVCALAEQGWDEGRCLAGGGSTELLPQAFGALVICEELDRAQEMVAAVRDGARAHGSVMGFLIASGHDAMIATRRGDLASAAAELRSTFERAAELGIAIAIVATVGYCGDVLLERPDAADIAAYVETLELGPVGEVSAGSMALDVRGRLRFAAGSTAAAIADLRQVLAVNAALGFVNPNGFPSCRSALALMLGREQRDEALELVNGELADARRIGQARGIGVALRALGLLEGGDDGRALVQEAVSVLADSPARLEHARALVELGALMRRERDRTLARATLLQGLDLAARCGAIRLSERARTELAAAGGRPRRLRVTGRDALTPSELRVAQMASVGQSSQQIAQALFVSTKTIDAHLQHSYAKLGINSRRQLTEALGGGSI